MTVLFMIIPICVGGFVGFYLSKSYKNRLEAVLEMQRIASEIKSSVAHFKQPISEIIASFKFKTEVENIAKNITFQPEYLKSEEVSALENLLVEVSYASCVKGSEKLEIYLESLKPIVEKASEEYKKRGLMFQKLGVLFGLLVGILLL